MQIQPHVVVHIDLIGHEHAGDVGTVLPQLLVPVGQVLVCDLPRHVEYKYAAVRPVVVRGVHPVEGFLTSCVPEVCGDNIPVHKQ